MFSHSGLSKDRKELTRSLLSFCRESEENTARIWSPWIISYHVRLGRTTTVATELPSGTSGIDSMRGIATSNCDLDPRMICDLAENEEDCYASSVLTVIHKQIRFHALKRPQEV